MEGRFVEMGRDGSCLDLWETGVVLDSEATRVLRREQLPSEKEGFVFRLRDSKGGTELSLARACVDRVAFLVRQESTKRDW